MSKNNGPARQFPFPGIPKTFDGSSAVVWVEQAITQGGCAYPITSSSVMGELYAAAVANGARNLWGEPLVFLELESEHSSASTCEGFALAGGRVTNFTSGQGLILMKEVLYTISGKRLPVVFHIGARALTSQALNVHAGHDDVMGVADCGWGILFARNAQEAGDFALIARRAAEEGETPFLNVQDGFLTTHTVEKILAPEPELMKQYIGSPSEKLKNLFNPEEEYPIMSGVVENQDAYMKGKIAQRWWYDRLLGIVQKAMDEFYELTGRRYFLVDSYRMEDAEYAIVGMGSFMETCQATVDWLRDREGLKIGAVSVICFRPFPGPQIVEALKGVKAFTVLERMDDPPAQSNPLTREIKAAFADALVGSPGYPQISRIPVIYSGAGGLGSRDVRPGDFVAIADNMLSGNGKRFFVVGIEHNLSLPVRIDPDVRPEGAYSMRGHSVGGWGSVTTNKVMADLLGDTFGMHVQAYPKYGSEKKGLPTTYYLTIAREHIRIHCELEKVEFVALNDPNQLNIGNPLAGLVPEGILFISTDKETPEEVWRSIPPRHRKRILENNIRVYALDAMKIARTFAPTFDLQTRFQGVVLVGVFLRTTPFQKEFELSNEQLFAGIERSLRKYFGKRGEQVVQANLQAIQRGYEEVFEVPRSVMEQLESPFLASTS